MQCNLPPILANIPAQHLRDWSQPEEHFGKQKSQIAGTYAGKNWLLVSQRDLVKDQAVLMSPDKPFLSWFGILSISLSNWWSNSKGVQETEISSITVAYCIIINKTKHHDDLWRNVVSVTTTPWGHLKNSFIQYSCRKKKKKICNTTVAYFATATFGTWFLCNAYFSWEGKSVYYLILF